MYGLKRQVTTKSYLIYERDPIDGWKLVKRTQDAAQIHPLEWYYFERIMTDNLYYIVVGDTMYDIIYHNEYR